MGPGGLSRGTKAGQRRFPSVPGAMKVRGESGLAALATSIEHVERGPDEELRIAKLAGLEMMDTPAEEAFDRLTRLATLVTGTPIALVSLVSEDPQFFKSAVGLPGP